MRCVGRVDALFTRPTHANDVAAPSQLSSGWSAGHGRQATVPAQQAAHRDVPWRAPATRSSAGHGSGTRRFAGWIAQASSGKVTCRATVRASARPRPLMPGWECRAMDGRWDDVVAVPTTMGDVGDPGQLVSSVSLLADGRAALLGWRSVATSPSEILGLTVQATSEFARCLLAARTAAGAMTGGGDVLFRLELPTGKAISDLVPAVGGGFRGVVRGTDGRFAGQVRLMPAAA